VITSAPPPGVAATPFIPVLAVGDALPASTLIDQQGRRFVLGSPRAGATVVTFFYARCPDPNECPLESAKIARLQRLLAGDDAHLVEVTVDPAHDTPAVLAPYGAAFGADPVRWTLATGEAGDIRALESRMGVAVTRTSRDAISHSDLVVILASDGRIADDIPGDAWTPAEVAAAVRTIESEPANPFARLRLALTRGVAAACGNAAETGGVSLLASFAIFAAMLGACALIVRRIFAR
jgi:protein SCO1/2